MLKSYLLSLGCFIDNEYLEEYLSFIEQPFSFSSTEYTEKYGLSVKSNLHGKLKSVNGLHFEYVT